MELKDRAKQKNERRNQKKAEPKTTKGPQIAWDELVTATASEEGAEGAEGVEGETTAEASSLRPDGPTRPDGPPPRPDGPTRPDGADTSTSGASRTSSSSAQRPAPRGSAR